MNHFLMNTISTALFFPRQTIHSFFRDPLCEQPWPCSQKVVGNYEQNTGNSELSRMGT